VLLLLLLMLVTVPAARCDSSCPAAASFTATSATGAGNAALTITLTFLVLQGRPKSLYSTSTLRIVFCLPIVLSGPPQVALLDVQEDGAQAGAAQGGELAAAKPNMLG